MDNQIRSTAAGKTFHDALERAAQDETFAKALITNPSGFRDEYQLTDEQIAAICSANETAVLQYSSEASLGYEVDVEDENPKDGGEIIIRP